MQFSHLATTEVDLYEPRDVLYLFAAAVPAARNTGESDSCCACVWLGPAGTNATVDVHRTKNVDRELHRSLPEGWDLTVRKLDGVEPADSEVLTDVAMVRVHSLDEVAAAFSEHVAPAYQSLT